MPEYVSGVVSPKLRTEIEEISEGYDRKLGFSNFLRDSAKYELGKYPYKPTLDVFVTDTYTAEDAWAHTEPERKVICIRPWERLSYDILMEHLLASVPMDIPFGPFTIHEGAHNLYRDAPEAAIRRMTMNPGVAYAVKERFNLKFYGRN